jgi:hypothetical protein
MALVSDGGDHVTQPSIQYGLADMSVKLISAIVGRAVVVVVVADVDVVVELPSVVVVEVVEVVVLFGIVMFGSIEVDEVDDVVVVVVV